MLGTELRYLNTPVTLINHLLVNTLYFVAKDYGIFRGTLNFDL